MSPDDYENVYTVERFPSCVQRICVLISITNDKLPEETETFHVVLSEGPNFDERIRLIPTLADVVITDDEGKNQYVALDIDLRILDSSTSSINQVYK